MDEVQAIRSGRGPRAVEELLLAELERRVLEVRETPRLAALPVRVVVPSRSLARHLGEVLVRRVGRAVLGVAIQTLYAVAFEISAAAGEPIPGGSALHPVLLRRLARREPALRERLDSLDDGYAVVDASVSDLLDAGYEASHLEALEEALADALPGGDECARAVARVAAGALPEGDALGIAHRSALIRAARDALLRDPDRVLPARTVLIHGYADATGVQTDLLEALLRAKGAILFLDRPADPADPAREDPGVAFGSRFRERLTGGAALGVEPAPSRPEIAVWHAAGPAAEVDAAALRIRELLDAGVVPERIAVVARSLSGVRLALRSRLRSLGIPFSGVGEPGCPQPVGRRLRGLLTLLRQAERTPAEVWLELVDPQERRLQPDQRADLRTAFHQLGAARLADVAQLEVERRAAQGAAQKLPVRTGLAHGAEEPEAPHRKLDGAVLDAAIRRAGAACEALARLAETRPLGEQLDRLEALLEECLDWDAGDAERAELRALGQRAEARDVELDGEELLLFLQRGLEWAGLDEIGGLGGGVQLLNVMEARARTFEHLFVLGVNREVFPRIVTEDALLTDAVRERLRRDVLPDLPVKRDGHDEERFLFAQLAAAAGVVTFSCAVSDDDGKARSVSPLLERLRLADGIEAPRVLPAPHGRAALERPARRTAREHTLLAGLHGSREQFSALLPEALREASELAEIPSEADDADSRLAVLAELDAAPQPRLGPYFGFVGPPREARDPRAASVYITALEGMARCPWQTFLERLLRVELPPDALGPLPAASPRESARLVGTLVHEVLEAIVAEATGSACGLDVSEVLAREPRAVPWPEPAALDALLAEKARDVRRREAIALAGFERVLAVHARRCLEVARELEWPGGRSRAAVLGGEVKGGLSVAGPQGQPVALRFRADRIDRDGEALRWLDYKTGRPFARQRRVASRHRALLQGVRSGEYLQAAAYAAAARELGGGDGSGAYAFLAADDELDAEQRILVADAGDEELAGVFAAAAAALLGARQEGSFFPRLVEPDLEQEPWRCQYCSVKEACLRGDSGARVRLERWVEERPAQPGPAERALRGAWDPGAV